MGSRHIPWVCPDCYVYLDSRATTQADALNELEKHRLRCPQKGVPIRDSPSRVDGLPKRPIQDLSLKELKARVGELEAILAAQRAGQNTPAIAEYGVPAYEKFPFRFLPPGELDIQEIIIHYRAEADKSRTNVSGRGIQLERLTKLNSLRPDRCAVGTDGWRGYIVFEFALVKQRVILECPVEGNATYVLFGDWRNMVGYSKLYLRTHYSDRCTRIVHKGDWLSRVKAALKG